MASTLSKSRRMPSLEKIKPRSHPDSMQNTFMQIQPNVIAYCEEKSAKCDQGDHGAYENEQEGHPRKAKRCFKCCETHRT